MFSPTCQAQGNEDMHALHISSQNNDKEFIIIWELSK